MLDLYIDDSGADSGPHCFLAGYLASKEKWQSFSDKWTALCQKYLEETPFDMTAAHQSARRGFIPEVGLVELAGCIVEHVDTEVWCALPTHDVDKIQEQYGFRFDRYRTCFLGMMEGILDHSYQFHSGTAISWFFDHHDNSPPTLSAEIETSLIGAFSEMRRSQRAENKALLHTMAFTDRQTVMPLQAADFLAWHKRSRHAKGADFPDPESYEVLRRAPMNRIEVVWFDHKLDDLLKRLNQAWRLVPPSCQHPKLGATTFAFLQLRRQVTKHGARNSRPKPMPRTAPVRRTRTLLTTGQLPAIVAQLIVRLL